jgi:hypothetical protein
LAPLPPEIIGEIGSHLDLKDLKRFRLVSPIFNYAAKIHFGKAMVCNRTMFPTYISIGTFISLLKHNAYLTGYIRSVTLVGEALRMHEVGYAFAWDRVGDKEDVWFTDKDIAIMRCVKEEMMREVAINGSFCNGGGYRTMLGKYPPLSKPGVLRGGFHVLSSAREDCELLPGHLYLSNTDSITGMMVAYLPKLEILYLRKLYPGEHIPGWKGPKALEGLSFYRPDLKVNDVFYGNWKYDTIHYRVTSWIDEFGEEMEEDGAGPQAQFGDDVIAVIEGSGREIWTEDA